MIFNRILFIVIISIIILPMGFFLLFKWIITGDEEAETGGKFIEYLEKKLLKK